MVLLQDLGSQIHNHPFESFNPSQYFMKTYKKIHSGFDFSVTIICGADLEVLIFLEAKNIIILSFTREPLLSLF